MEELYRFREFLNEGVERYKKPDYSDEPIVQQYLDKYWDRIIKQMENAQDELNKNELWSMYMPKSNTLSPEDVYNNILNMFDQVHRDPDLLDDGDPNDPDSGWVDFYDLYLVSKSKELGEEILKDYNNTNKFLQWIDVVNIDDNGMVSYFKDGGRERKLPIDDIMYEFYPTVHGSGLYHREDAFSNINSKFILKKLGFIE